MKQKTVRESIYVSRDLFDVIDSKFESIEERGEAARAYLEFGFNGIEPEEKFSFVKELFEKTQREAEATK